jgi:hypothetical protein
MHVHFLLTLGIQRNNQGTHIAKLAFKWVTLVGWDFLFITQTEHKFTYLTGMKIHKIS